MFVVGVLGVEAYETDVWNYIKANPTRLAPKPIETSLADPLADTMTGSPSHHTTNGSGASGSKEEAPQATMTITVRSGKEEGLQMDVKPTTTMNAIAKQYIRHVKGDSISDVELRGMLSRCRLEFDGDHLDLKTRVQETDIDDGEVIDLVFL